MLTTNKDKHTCSQFGNISYLKSLNSNSQPSVDKSNSILQSPNKEQSNEIKKEHQDSGYNYRHKKAISDYFDSLAISSD